MLFLICLWFRQQISCKNCFFNITFEALHAVCFKCFLLFAAVQPHVSDKHASFRKILFAFSCSIMSLCIKLSRQLLQFSRSSIKSEPFSDIAYIHHSHDCLCILQQTFAHSCLFILGMISFQCIIPLHYEMWLF